MGNALRGGGSASFWKLKCTQCARGDAYVVYCSIQVHLVFDDNIEQNVSKTWVVQRMRACDLVVEIGDVADVHFEVGEDVH